MAARLASTPGQGDSSGGRAIEFLAALRRRIWIFGACVVVIPLAVYVAVAVQPRKHEASAIVESQPLAPMSLVVLPDLPTGWFVDPGPEFVAILARTGAVRVAAAHRVGKQPADFGTVTATVDKKAGWVTISVSDVTSREAVAEVRALTDAIAENIHGRVARAIGSLRSGLVVRLRDAHDGATRRALTAQLVQFERFRPESQPAIQVVEPPVGSRLVSNQPGRAAALALLLAIFVGIRLVRLAERSDPRLHDVFEVEESAGLASLTLVPADSRSPEAFLRLRDALIHLRGQGAGSTVVVASPLRRDGRTTVCEGLARAYAAVGLRTVLVEADLVNPRLSTRLAVPPGPGLAEVLDGADVLGSLRELGPLLSVLPAGEQEPGARDGLGSARMSSVLRELSDYADVVVVDTPALLEASDALAIVGGSTGVAVVARMEHTRRRALQRAVRILEKAGANLLGPVVVGVEAAPSGAVSPGLARALEPAVQGRGD